MSDWEKEKGINLRKKKARKKGKYRANSSNKENNLATISVNKESESMKGERILKEANIKIRSWIEGGKKEGWIKFKNK